MDPTYGKRFDIFSPRLGDAQKVYVHSDFSLNMYFFFKHVCLGLSMSWEREANINWSMVICQYMYSSTYYVR